MRLRNEIALPRPGPGAEPFPRPLRPDPETNRTCFAKPSTPSASFRMPPSDISPARLFEGRDWGLGNGKISNHLRSCLLPIPSHGSRFTTYEVHAPSRRCRGRRPERAGPSSTIRLHPGYRARSPELRLHRGLVDGRRRDDVRLHHPAQVVQNVMVDSSPRGASMASVPVPERSCTATIRGSSSPKSEVLPSVAATFQGPAELRRLGGVVGKDAGGADPGGGPVAGQFSGGPRRRQVGVQRPAGMFGVGIGDRPAPPAAPVVPGHRKPAAVGEGQRLPRARRIRRRPETARRVPAARAEGG